MKCIWLTRLVFISCSFRIFTSIPVRYCPVALKLCFHHSCLKTCSSALYLCPGESGVDWPLVLGSFSAVMLFLCSVVVVAAVVHRKGIHGSLLSRRFSDACPTAFSYLFVPLIPCFQSKSSSEGKEAKVWFCLSVCSVYNLDEFLRGHFDQNIYLFSATLNWGQRGKPKSIDRIVNGILFTRFRRDAKFWSRFHGKDNVVGMSHRSFYYSLGA